MKMMIRNILMLYLIILIQGCEAQTSTNSRICNRKAADKSIVRQLLKGICIPDNYTADEVIQIDYNKDKKIDVVVRYSDFPLKNGGKRFYGIFERLADTVFVLKKQFENIFPPYLKNIYAASSSSDTLENFLVRSYPYDIKLEFIQDTIKLSHLIPDYYGKTYEFVFDKQLNNWYLRSTKYWIGGLDERDVERMELTPKLIKRNVIEIKKPTKLISIDNFDLALSRNIADTEEKEYLTNTQNLFDWSKKNK